MHSKVYMGPRSMEMDNILDEDSVGSSSRLADMLFNKRKELLQCKFAVDRLFGVEVSPLHGGKRRGAHLQLLRAITGSGN